MALDWGQIVTHIIGFLITVWLLRKYAWDGILGMVHKRQDVIAQSFADIEQGKVEVQVQKDKYDAELQGIEDTRREKIQEAAHQAEHLAGEIKEEARRDALAARDKAKQDISIELDKANDVLKERMIAAIITTTEKVLEEKLDRDKHNEIIERYLADVKIG